MKQIKVATPWVFLALSVGGCDSDTTRRTSGLPWDEGHVQVVGADGEVSQVALPQGDECLVVKVGEEFAETETCAKPQQECEGRAADVLVDAKGNVLDILCYPATETTTVSELEASNGKVAQNQNNSVIVLNSDPAVDFVGDLAVDANNVILYGDDPATSVVDGSLGIDGNNAVVRGVRITGDVTITKNNATFFHCVIEGNLTINANNTVVAGCDVFGTVTITGGNTKLVGNHFVQAPQIKGQNTHCEANLMAEVAGDNGVIEGSELGQALDCK